MLGRLELQVPLQEGGYRTAVAEVRSARVRLSPPAKRRRGRKPLSLGLIEVRDGRIASARAIVISEGGIGMVYLTDPGTAERDRESVRRLFRGAEGIAGASVIVKAFAIVIIGGFGNVEGTIIAGLIVGLIESYTTQILGPGLIDIVVFALLLLMLAVRPTGLIAERREENV